ncbi:PAS domain S-box protein [Geobacter pelophilus]|uniref:histidine kinase n=1 Tax=Geoanaerobacter pelophilus TaxID=60036 RepID=A0AAW4LDH4_9BACT|nr:PAS domain S-box protein [Geoanaerobacter pelophilus]MBT0666595.1 PAS domain S-box protein [Geoanaerobacter pelophilus]
MSLKKQLLVGLILGMAGFAGNWFKYSLFLNIDFLFGSFFVMTAVLYCGTLSGVIASLIASFCTYILWKHPYAMVIFTAEAAIVGLFNARRKKADILLHDFIYWLIIGGPLVWLFYHHYLGDLHQSTYLIMLKQSMNGIFNTLLASIIYLILTSREKVTGNLPSFQQIVFTIMVSLVLLPAFLITFYNLRSELDESETRLAEQTKRGADTARSSVSEWIKERQQVITSLASRIGNPDKRSFQEMQEILGITLDASPPFWRMGVMNSTASTVAYMPLKDELGKSTIGVSFADRPYIASLRKEKTPYIAGVVIGKLGKKIPIVPFISPIVATGEYKGFCVGVLKADIMGQHLKYIIGKRKMNITILDQSGLVVVSTRKNMPIMSRYERPVAGTYRQISTGVALWTPPPEPGKNLMQRWSKSLFIAEEEISAVNKWKVIVENSYEPALIDLRDKAIFSLFILITLSIFTIPISYLLSRLLTRSLERIRLSTSSLPNDINNCHVEALPGSSIKEVAVLIEHFNESRKKLQNNHDSLVEMYEKLEAQASELQASENRYRTLVTHSPDAVFVVQDKRFVYANPAAIKLHGAEKAEQLLDQEVIHFINSAYREQIFKRMEMVLQGETTASYESSIVRIDGNTLPIESVGVPVEFNGRPAIQVIMRDISERKRADEQIKSLNINLQQRVDELQTIFETVPIGLAIAEDSSGQRIKGNSAIAAQLGINAVSDLSYASGKCSYTVYREGQQLQLLDLPMQRAVRGEKVAGDVLEIRRSDEVKLVLHCNAVPLLDGSGKPRGAVGTFLDITHLKRSEERLNLLADTAGLLLIAESPLDAIESLCIRALSILDCHVFFNFISDASSRQLRLNACAGIPDSDRDKIERLDYGVAVCGCVAQDACRIIAEDIPNTPDIRTELVNSYGIKAYVCHPLLRGEEVLGTLSFGTRTRSFFDSDDIAVMKALSDFVAIAIERKRIEESLERAKRDWERTFDAVPDLISILDKHHKIIRLNKAMAAHLNKHPKECIGLECHEAIHGSSIPPSFCPHTLSLDDGKTHHAELHEETLGGDFLISTTPLLDQSGEMIGTVHMARDISDRKRVEEALRKAHDELENRVAERTADLASLVEVLQQEVMERIKAEEAFNLESEERIKAVERLREQEKFMVLQSRQAAMGEMIGNIAHQWRQPLNILGLLIQQMQMYHEIGHFDSKYLDQSVKKGMEIIQHMSRTIDDFRDFFRPDKEPVVFSITEAIEKAISLVKESFASNLISIHCRMDSKSVTEGYPNEFSQVLLNILINARDVLIERKAIDPEISISVDSNDDKCTIKISDNGGGVSDDIIEKVFDPYFTTKGVQQGTGLGLYMAKTIIEKNMNGMLTVSNGSKGAEFRIEVVRVIQ